MFNVLEEFIDTVIEGVLHRLELKDRPLLTVIFRGLITMFAMFLILRIARVFQGFATESIGGDAKASALVGIIAIILFFIAYLFESIQDN